jgi:hypothetical protein
MIMMIVIAKIHCSSNMWQGDKEGEERGEG